MYTCANCSVLACRTGSKENLPKNCPMREEALMQECFEAYLLPENHDFYVNSSSIEAEGYGQWPRLKETMMLCRKMGYQKIGLAFCGGLHKEAKVVSEIFRRNGFQVVSVMCKAGGIHKEAVGIPEEGRMNPGEFEPMCNPIAQARLLALQKTEFNVVLGLCVGHDSTFYKYSEAMTTTLVAKDRVLAHNPCGAIYCADGYFKKKVDVE